MASITMAGRITAALELLFFVTLAVGAKAWLSQYTWQFAGPITLTGVVILLGVYLKARGYTFASIGLKPLTSVKQYLWLLPQTALVFAAFIAVVATILLGSQALGLDFMMEQPAGAEERWGNLEGNLPLFLLWLTIAWVVAGFGEEVFFRGFLITRTETLFSGSVLTPVLAVLLPALLFGFGHMYYQGMRGLIMTGAIALAFGAMFFVLKRNLWPIILVHGGVDTIGFVARYLNLDV